MTSLLRASSAIRVALKHLALYAPLVRSAATEYREAVVRRMLAMVLAVCTALAAAVVGAVWLVMSLWNLEFRHWFIGAAMVVLLLASFLLARVSTARREPGPHGQKLRYELAQDQALIREWQGSGDERASG